MQLSDFKNKVKYKYIGKAALFTPHGIITNKYKYSHTGKEWKNILVYDFDDTRGKPTPFSKMFKVVK